jgi:hypothetical protein
MAQAFGNDFSFLVLPLPTLDNVLQHVELVCVETLLQYLISRDLSPKVVCFGIQRAALFEACAVSQHYFDTIEDHMMLALVIRLNREPFQIHTPVELRGPHAMSGDGAK